MAEGGLNPEAPKPEPSPLAGQVPEADQQAIERAQDRIVDAIQEGGARSALEDLAGESAEQTTEQQKVEALYQKITQVNEELGGEFATAFEGDDRGTTLLFNQSVGDMKDFDVYGANSVKGPVRLGTLASKRIVNSDGRLNPGSMERLNFDYTGAVTTVEGMQRWQEAFESSRDSVLRDQEAMQKVREQRSQTLDSALEVVSKPIDIDAPPPPAAPSGQGK